MAGAGLKPKIAGFRSINNADHLATVLPLGSIYESTIGNGTGVSL